MIIKSGAQNLKVYMMHSSWMLLVLHPSLSIATQLKAGLMKKAEQFKSGLGKCSSFQLRWELCNAYKSDKKVNKELIWRVGCEPYNTTKIVVLLQRSEKDNSYIQKIIVFDHLITNIIEVSVNGYKYPQEDSKCHFSDANEDYSTSYLRFLQLGYQHKNVQSGTILNYIDLKTVYPSFCFHVSKNE